jgi:hypothetical protein
MSAIVEGTQPHGLLNGDVLSHVTPNGEVDVGTGTKGHKQEQPQASSKTSTETPQPDSNLPPLWDHCIDDLRPIKVICIGAGISGMCAAIRFNQRIKNLDFVAYEKNADIGGTWFENRYPGVRCDIPSHSYQYTFESNTAWSEYYASGPEIQQYLLNTARKYGVYKYVKFRHELKGATWHADEGKWEVKIQNLQTGEVN